MKVLLLLVISVVIRQWTCANPLPCADESCSPDFKKHELHENELQDTHRTKRDVLKSVTSSVKDASTYVGRKLHIIRKRETNGARDIICESEVVTRGGQIVHADDDCDRKEDRGMKGGPISRSNLSPEHEVPKEAQEVRVKRNTTGANEPGKEADKEDTSKNNTKEKEKYNVVAANKTDVAKNSKKRTTEEAEGPKENDSAELVKNDTEVSQPSSNSSSTATPRETVKEDASTTSTPDGHAVTNQTNDNRVKRATAIPGQRKINTTKIVHHHHGKYRSIRCTKNLKDEDSSQESKSFGEPRAAREAPEAKNSTKSKREASENSNENKDATKDGKETAEAKREVAEGSDPTKGEKQETADTDKENSGESSSTLKALAKRGTPENNNATKEANEDVNVAPRAKRKLLKRNNATIKPKNFNANKDGKEYERKTPRDKREAPEAKNAIVKEKARRNAPENSNLTIEGNDQTHKVKRETTENNNGTKADKENERDKRRTPETERVAVKGEKVDEKETPSVNARNDGNKNASEAPRVGRNAHKTNNVTINVKIRREMPKNTNATKDGKEDAKEKPELKRETSENNNTTTCPKKNEKEIKKDDNKENNVSVEPKIEIQDEKEKEKVKREAPKEDNSTTKPKIKEDTPETSNSTEAEKGDGKETPEVKREAPTPDNSDNLTKTPKTEVGDSATAEGVDKKERPQIKRDVTKESDSSKIPRIKRQESNTTEDELKVIEAQAVTRDTPSKISQAKEVKESNNPKVSRSVDDKDGGEDPRYLLIHDVPPCRKKRDLDDYGQQNSCDSRNQAKNITIIIQNLKENIRKKRQASSNSSHPSATGINATGTKESDSTKIPRIKRQDSNTTEDELKVIEEAQAVKRDTPDESSQEKDSKIKAVSGATAKEVKESNNTKVSRSIDDKDGGEDPRYLLIHDVPPCRRKRDLDDYGQQNSCDSRNQVKNITIIIQNLVENLRKRRQASSNSSHPSATGINAEKISKRDAGNETDDTNVERDRRMIGLEELIKRMRIMRAASSNSSSNATSAAGDETDDKHKREIATDADHNGKSCCPRHSRSLSELNDDEEQMPDTSTETNEGKRQTHIMRISPKGHGTSQSLENSAEGDKGLSRGTRSVKIGRSLLTVTDTDSEEENEIVSSDKEFETPMNLAEAQPVVNIGNSFHKNFLINDERLEYQMSTEKPNKDLDHVRCACAMFFDELNSEDKNPFISECFLEVLKEKSQKDREVLCSKACSDTSKLYFKLKQVALCTHITDFHRHLQAKVPLDHISKDENNNSETIFCQVLPGEAEPPLKYLVSWLNIILLDVVVCLTGLGIVCMYLICFVSWRRREHIPVYTSASFTMK